MNCFNQEEKCILSTRPKPDALNDCKVLSLKGIKAYPSPSMVVHYNKQKIRK